MDLSEDPNRFERLRRALAETTHSDLGAVEQQLREHIGHRATGAENLFAEFWNVICDEGARRGTMLYILEEELDDGDGQRQDAEGQG